MRAENPLVGIRLPIPFDQVQPGHVLPAFDRLIEEAQAGIDAIGRGGGENWAATMEALDQVTESLDYAAGVVRHLEIVATTPELRDAWNQAQPRLSAFYAGIPLHSALWSAIKAYSAGPEARGLSGVRQRYLNKTVESFRRAGADLAPDDKNKLREFDVELAVVTTRYAQNVVDATTRFEWLAGSEAQLAGLPALAREQARQSAGERGQPGWRFTLQQPSYLALMTYLNDAQVRERFWRAYNTRAAAGDLDNTALLGRILELRRAKASLLGFAHFADLVLEDRMARSGAAAQEFVGGLEEQTRRHFERENAALLAFRREAEASAAGMAPWDVGYWAEKQRAARYDFDEEELRPYFPLASVLAGLFELARRLFAIEVREAPGAPAWHAAVRHYEIRERGGSLLATFYVDWFPRETKRGGAWMDSFLTGRVVEGSWRPHVASMCGNLTPPAGAKPALLSHRDVETIFHEFGHLLHGCLSRVEIRSFAGTSVAWDFVELPSQIMENWCWDRASLDLFARHWETGAPIPEDLFQKMLRARTYRAATAQMRQLGFAHTDLALHIDYDPAAHGGVLEYSRRTLESFSPAPLPADYAMFASFGHLFADPVGYGAGYYSYKWAEVLDADCFDRFRQEGLFNHETGLDFRRCILEKGGSEEPAQLFRAFRGRDPDPTALLERLGLLA